MKVGRFNLGIAGQLANVAFYRAGFQPPSNPFFQQGEDKIETNTRVHLDAFNGYQIHWTVAQEALRRLNAANEAYRRFALLDDVAATLEASRNVRLIWLAEGHRLIRDGIRTLIDDVRAMLYVLLRRVTDTINEVRVAKADYDAGLLSEEEFNVVLLDAYLELQQIDKEIDDILSDLEQTMSLVGDTMPDVDTNAAQALERLVDVYTDYVDSTIMSDFGDYVSTLLNVRRHTRLSGVKFAIRNLKDGTEFGWSV